MAKITSVVTLQVHGNDTDLSKELQEAAQEIAALSEKIKVQTVPQSPEDIPYLSLLKGENTDTGIAFHGVPGGHEFTSFILALYNVAGPGQEMDEETKTALADIDATGKKDSHESACISFLHNVPRRGSGNAKIGSCFLSYYGGNV